GFAKCNVAGKILSERKHAEIVEQSGEEDPRARQMKNTTFKWNAERWKEWDTLGPEVTANLGKRGRWLIPLDAHEAMILAGDTLFVGGEESVHAVAAKTGRVLWSG
ncbi:MAG: hypothetical protein GTN65_08340, partial [Armatimonadetes bacterium]|nr:hypothetical protein [Armatimonadota bacterium]NIO97093.1 hypothetical protein [Armatimonadota bacterium]